MFVVKSGKMNKVVANRAKALKWRGAATQELYSVGTTSVAAVSFRKTIRVKVMVWGVFWLLPYLIEVVKFLPHHC